MTEYLYFIISRHCLQHTVEPVSYLIRCSESEKQDKRDRKTFRFAYFSTLGSHKPALCRLSKKGFQSTIQSIVANGLHAADLFIIPRAEKRACDGIC